MTKQQFQSLYKSDPDRAFVDYLNAQINGELAILHKYAIAYMNSVYDVEVKTFPDRQSLFDYCVNASQRGRCESTQIGYMHVLCVFVPKA